MGAGSNVRTRGAALPWRRFVCGAVLLMLASVSACGKDTVGRPPDPLDVSATPVPHDLQRPLDQARASLRGHGNTTPAARDLAVYFDLMARIQRPATRQEAGDELYARWRAEPTHFLWIDLAIRFTPMLKRSAERNEIYALPALADSQSAVGAFALGRRYFGYGDRGQHYTRAEGGMASLDSLQQVWLATKLAKVDADNGRTLEAVSRLLAWLPQARAVGGVGLEAELWREIAEDLQRADRLDGALHAAVMSVDLARAAGFAYAEVQSFQTVAGILADRRETALALDLFARGVDRCTSLDFPLLGTVTLDRASKTLNDLGDRRQALVFDLRNVAHAIAMGDSVNLPRAIMNVADDHRRLGQLDSCLVYQRRAQNLVARSSSEYNRAILPAKLAPYYCQIGDLATADSLLDVAATMAATTGTKAYEADIQVDLLRDALEVDNSDLAYRAISRLHQLRPSIGDDRLFASYELAAAEFLTRQGEFALARDALDRATPAVARCANQDLSWQCAVGNGRLAALRGDLDTARAHFEQGLALAEQADDDDQTAISRLQLGEVLLEQGRYDAARQLFQHDGDSSYGDRSRTQLASHLYLGIAWLRDGQPDLARAELAKALARSARRAPGDLRTRLQIEAARVEVALGHAREAERFALAALELMDRTTDTGWLKDMPSLGGDLRHDALEILIGLYADHPRLVRGADHIRRTLALAGGGMPALPLPEGVVATYFVGRERSFLWVTDASGATGQTTLSGLPGRPDLLELATRVITSLERPGRPADAAALRQLSEVLLRPVEARWRSGATLMIVPDGVLDAVPWAALPLADGRPAIARGPILEGARTTRGEASRGRPSSLRDPPPGDLLAIGCDAALASPRLRAAEAEARQVAGLWSPRRQVLRLGSAAAWDSVTGLDLARFEAIHIATHAVTYSGLPSTATLRFADHPQDRPVTVASVRELPLRARLVYLSCCEAASRSGGSSVDNFARAFLDAGSQAVVASTIRIDDEAAAQVAVEFYRQWQTGEPPATALRAALLKLRATRREWEHPYYWAFYRTVVPGPP